MHLDIEILTKWWAMPTANQEKENTMKDTILWGVTSGLKTMADDTVRIQIDINPNFFDEACKQFGKRGVEVALAQLVQGTTIGMDGISIEEEKVSIEANEKSVEPEKDENGNHREDKVRLNKDGRPVGGELSKLAGQFCQQEVFWEFLYTFEHGDIGYAEAPIYNAQDAAALLRVILNIESRSEIDHNEAAEAMFHTVRTAYLNFQENE